LPQSAFVTHSTQRDDFGSQNSPPVQSAFEVQAGEQL
jgi:hypothetical protein